MKKIFLVGYYGYNNFGDDLLLKSTFKILNEIGFNDTLIIPSEIDFLSKKMRNILKFNVEIINKYDIFSMKKNIKDSDLIIYGGGNLLQSETSLKSYYYYYEICKVAIKYNKKILFLSQGFGPLKHKTANKKLKKIMKYENLFGIYRDKVSYNYSKKYNKNSYFGMDIGPYSLNAYKNKKERKISLCLKNSYSNLKYLIDFLNIFSDYTITPLIINSNQDSITNYALVESIRKDTMNEVLFPYKDFNKIQEEIATSSLVISDRLHSSLASIFYETPVLTKLTKKNRRVLKSIDNKYNFFYNRLLDIPESYFRLLKYNFLETSETYKIRLNDTINLSKQIIQNVL
ncbi:polysaccharide pyruvyl transferase CsaB [Tepiditoga spiralis]|uniref:Polysaccharide pyruvyl transferase CsaB n=1 Tax=Tepiditoga spiralis TaxID=2108365 RepID=A0A7G1G4G9_9BACT|nr:polysaccharide pyruvyl transferase family protein [Tepiditoga spiralis]BBE30995.1 polysaccharide pyruvyl transferase CsaB [Tepiditoga spiralis]